MLAIGVICMLLAVKSALLDLPWWLHFGVEQDKGGLDPCGTVEMRALKEKAHSAHRYRLDVF